MPSATAIVARSYPDRVIGVQNELPWHLRTDLQHFKRTTLGHAVVMGRRTFESLGKPLPRRLNVVLSRRPIDESRNVKRAPDPETALLYADVHSIINSQKEFFVIGGEEIFSIMYKYINSVWLTDVFTGRMNGDASFDQEFLPSEWRTRSEEDFPRSEHDEFGFRITLFERIKKFHRERSKEEFVRSSQAVLDKLDEWTREHEPSPAGTESTGSLPSQLPLRRAV